MFTGNEGTPISAANALALSQSWLLTYPGQSSFYDYSSSVIYTLLTQPYCVGIRTYFSINSASLASQVLVGSTSDEDDLVNGDLLSEGSSISLGTASQQTAAWRNNNPGTTLAVFIGINPINALLSQVSAEGIRIYFGHNTTLVVNTIWMEATNKDNIPLPEGVKLNFGSLCPTRCGVANQLNS